MSLQCFPQQQEVREFRHALLPQRVEQLSRNLLGYKWPRVLSATAGFPRKKVVYLEETQENNKASRTPPSETVSYGHMRGEEPYIRSAYLLLVVSEYERGRVLTKYQLRACVQERAFTFTGAFTRSVITSTNVPPNVHQTLKVLIRPMAFVPIVLTMPDIILIAQATAAISTRVKDRP